ncbi:antibiotic biosynthesis monooxygenase [Xylophilus sp. Kf1]|nr:antibiotic biosynthesis monooxygenase [Xylophilus sp. Kf1]
MNQPLLQIVATMVARPDQADAVRALLVATIDDFRVEPGCSGYILTEDRRRPGRFMTYETWSDEAALAAHMHSPAMTALGPKLTPLLDGDIRQDFLSVLIAL